MLNIEKNMEKDALFITLEGQLDTLSSPDFEAKLEPLLADASSLTIDFEKLDYISSAGLRVLLSAEQVLEEKGMGPVRIINCNKTIRDIIGMTGFTGILSIE